MNKIASKIENWLWIVVFVAALLYFHWLLGELHVENAKLESAQANNKQAQIQIQVQLKEIVRDISKFLQPKPESEQKEKLPNP